MAKLHSREREQFVTRLRRHAADGLHNSPLGRCGTHARLRVCCIAALLLCLLPAAMLTAATFSSAYYDSNSNELVVTLVYGGTNPNHQFTAQWGTCRTLGNQGNHQIAVVLLDSQWDDAAQQSFTTTVHISLAGVSCHPAVVTLRTAPKYEYTVQIP